MQFDIIKADNSPIPKDIQKEFKNTASYFPKVVYKEVFDEHYKRIYGATIVRRFYEGQWYRVILVVWFDIGIYNLERAKLHILHDIMTTAYKIQFLYIPNEGDGWDIDPLQVSEEARLVDLINKQEL